VPERLCTGDAGSDTQRMQRINAAWSDSAVSVGCNECDDHCGPFARPGVGAALPFR